MHFLRLLTGVLTGLVAAAALRAQTTLYVTVSPFFHTFNATTGAVLAAPQGSTGTFNWQAALDGNGRFYVAHYGLGTVGVYDAASGAAINSALVPDVVGSPTALGVWQNSLIVGAENQSRLSRFDATTGALLNANFVTGLVSPRYLAFDSAGRLFVSDYNGTVGVFDAGTGAVLNRNFLGSLPSVPMGIAVNALANRLYVAFPQTNNVSVYDATSGGLLTSSLIAGLTSPRALALDPAGALLVSSYNSAGGYYQVGRFDEATGAVLNAQLLINGANISSLNLQTVPEPATWVGVTLGLAVLGLRYRRRWG